MADPFRHFLDLDDELLWLRWDKFWQTWCWAVVIGAAVVVDLGIWIFNMMWR